MSHDRVIDMLGWLPPEPRLSASLRRAFGAAAAAEHDAVKIEHLLAAFLDDVDASVYFATREVELNFIRDHCHRVIGEKAMRVAAGKDKSAAETPKRAEAAGSALGAKAVAPRAPQPPTGAPSQSLTQTSQSAVASGGRSMQVVAGAASPVGAPQQRQQQDPIHRDLRRIHPHALRPTQHANPSPEDKTAPSAPGPAAPPRPSPFDEFSRAFEAAPGRAAPTLPAVSTSVDPMSTSLEAQTVSVAARSGMEGRTASNPFGAPTRPAATGAQPVRRTVQTATHRPTYTASESRPSQGAAHGSVHASHHRSPAPTHAPVPQEPRFGAPTTPSSTPALQPAAVAPSLSTQPNSTPPMSTPPMSTPPMSTPPMSAETAPTGPFHAPSLSAPFPALPSATPAATQSAHLAATAAATPVAAPIRTPIASPGLRRLMGRASDIAEQAEAEKVSSECAIKAIAYDDATESGRLLRRLLPQHELETFDPIAKAAAEKRKADKEAGEAERLRERKARAEKAAADAVVEPAFSIVSERAEGLLKLLQRELQKDMRYRLVNDLVSYLNGRDADTVLTPDSDDLRHSALPILRSTHSELARDPHYRAFDQVRRSLVTLKLEEDRIVGVLGALVAREGHPSTSALAKSVQAIVEVSPTNGESEAANGAARLALVSQDLGATVDAIEATVRQAAAEAAAAAISLEHTEIVDDDLTDDRPAFDLRGVFARRRRSEEPMDAEERAASAALP